MTYDLETTKQWAREIIEAHPDWRNPLSGTSMCLYNGPQGRGCIAQTLFREKAGFSVPESCEGETVDSMKSKELLEIPFEDDAIDFLSWLQGRADDVHWDDVEIRWVSQPWRLIDVESYDPED